MKHGVNFIDRNNIRRHLEQGRDAQYISKSLSIHVKTVEGAIKSMISPQQRAANTRALNREKENQHGQAVDS